jgi:hypothetical protein
MAITMASDKDIDRLVDDFVTRLRAMISQATRDEVSEAIRKMLGEGGSAGGGRGRGRGRPRALAGGTDALGRRRKRTEAQIEQQTSKLYDYIKGHPGERMETISRELGLPSTLLAPLAKRLVEEKRIKAKGKARGTTYSAS